MGASACAKHAFGSPRAWGVGPNAAGVINIVSSDFSDPFMDDEFGEDGRLLTAIPCDGSAWPSPCDSRAATRAAIDARC